MYLTRKIAVALAAAAVTAAGTAAVVDAAAASTTSHTIRLTAVALKTTQIKNSFTQAEKDVQRGKVTGYDSVSCVIDNTIHKAVCDGSFARATGMLYVHATVGQAGHGAGKVTGGTRAYKGATGTITLAPGTTQNRTKITITWTR
jgi:hypothetical protein